MFQNNTSTGILSSFYPLVLFSRCDSFPYMASFRPGFPRKKERRYRVASDALTTATRVNNGMAFRERKRLAVIVAPFAEDGNLTCGNSSDSNFEHERIQNRNSGITYNMTYIYGATTFRFHFRPFYNSLFKNTSRKAKKYKNKFYANT